LLRLRLLLLLGVLEGPSGDGDKRGGVTTASSEFLFYWLLISSLLGGLPVSVKAYDWPPRIIADCRRRRELRAAVFEAHACGLSNVVGADLDAVFTRHVTRLNWRLGAGIGGVVRVARLRRGISMDLILRYHVHRACGRRISSSRRHLTGELDPVEWVLWLGSQRLRRRHVGGRSLGFLRCWTFRLFPYLVS
jgi:hypothetical protein